MSDTIENAFPFKNIVAMQKDDSRNTVVYKVLLVHGHSLNIHGDDALKLWDRFVQKNEDMCVILS